MISRADWNLTRKVESSRRFKLQGSYSGCKLCFAKIMSTQMIVVPVFRKFQISSKPVLLEWSWLNLKAKNRGDYHDKTKNLKPGLKLKCIWVCWLDHASHGGSGPGSLPGVPRNSASHGTGFNLANSESSQPPRLSDSEFRVRVGRYTGEDIVPVFWRI